MLEYDSLDKVEIVGRGTVFVVENEKDRSPKEIKELLGQEVIIDGDVYTIKGVETFSIPYYRKGYRLGILV